MRAYFLSISGLLAGLSAVAAVPHSPPCRYLPSDLQWPRPAQWQSLNQSVGGRLIRGEPLASVCHGVDYNQSACALLQASWTDPPLYPFSSRSSSCTLGNIASYAINVTSPQDVAAGLAFAQTHNIRLSVKNTGHDFLGRSAGAGSLALWMHNLKDIQLLNYTSHGSGYSGPALKMDAGVQAFEAYQVSASHGYRVTGAFSPTVGLVGGYVQGGGHGPLQGAYGLAADNTLEFEVVTADGRHIVATPTENEDLYWALNGGGGGTYAVVLSQTTKAHADGIVAGASLSFSAQKTRINTKADSVAADPYWAAIEAWHRQLSVHDAIPKMTTLFGFTSTQFTLSAVSLPDSPASAIDTILAPFTRELTTLGLQYTYELTNHPTHLDHYTTYTPGLPDGVAMTNSTVGGRLIPRQTVQNALPDLISALRQITAQPGSRINGIAANLTHARVGNTIGSNAILPAWRDALYTLNMDGYFDPAAPREVIREHQAQMNRNQNLLKAVIQGQGSGEIGKGGGAYLNEATFDNPDWREDYFGPNYPRLSEVKRKYDPGNLFYGPATVGSEHWRTASDGRLCVAGEGLW
ncbi:hypothetical protein BJX76DRAFT_345774 [Aspergillus varians]